MVNLVRRRLPHCDWGSQDWGSEDRGFEFPLRLTASDGDLTTTDLVLVEVVTS
jgi:hypothetical protein